MSRIATPNIAIGTWEENENPGAGSQTVETGNTGVNFNFLRLDTAVGTEHTSAGAHKANVIDGPSLKTTVADGASIVLTGTPLKLRVGPLGILTAMLALDSVDATILKDDASVDANRAVTTNHIRDLAVTAAKIAALAVTTAKIAADAVTAAEISHDNNRTKQILAFAYNEPGGAVAYAKLGTIAFTTTRGIPAVNPFCVTGWSNVAPGGTVTRATAVYSLVADRHYAQGDKLQVNFRNLTDATPNFEIHKNGIAVTTIAAVGPSTAAVAIGDNFFCIEIEYDD